MTDWTEADIVIGGIKLSPAQSMAVRVAMGQMILDMQNNGLGNDDTGKAIAKGYVDRGSEVLNVIYQSIQAKKDVRAQLTPVQITTPGSGQLP